MTEPPPSKMSPIACTNCRVKKQKCGLEQPECVRCRNRKLACSYPTSRRRPGPRKASTPVNMSALHERIGRLESLLQTYSDGSGFEKRGTRVSENGLSGGLEHNLKTPVDPSAGPSDGPSPRTPAFGSCPTEDPTEFGVSLNDFRVRLLYEIPDPRKASADFDRLGLYFSSIQPIFPLFREPKFLQDLYSGAVSTSLITVMMSLASRFSITAPEDGSLALAVNRIEQEIEQKEMAPPSISLNDIKLACLCIIHQLASGPNRYTWKVMEKLARIVRGCKLHQVDSCTQAIGYFPASSLEELRYVWWTVVKIDASCNLLSGTSFLLDVETATTSLVTTSVSEFTAGVGRDQCPPHIPRSTDAAFWNLHEDASNASLADGQRLQLSISLILRECGGLLRGILQNPEDQELEARMLLTHSKYMRVCTVLPTWYMAPRLATELHETPTRHRVRLDALLQLRIGCIYAVIPSMISLKSRMPAGLDWKAALLRLWDLFTYHLNAAVEIFEAMPSAYYRTCDPMMSSSVWILGCMVSFCIMLWALPDENAEERKKRFEKAFNVLVNCLTGFAGMWRMSRNMLESLESMRGWHAFHLEMGEVLNLLRRLQVPMPVYDAPPEALYDVDVVGALETSSDEHSPPLLA